MAGAAPYQNPVSVLPGITATGLTAWPRNCKIEKL